MSIPGDHLLSSSRALLRLNREERIYKIQDDDRVWIDYEKAAMVCDIVSQFCRLPSRAQAPCLVVYGEGGSGKSSIIRQLKKDNFIRDRSIFIALNVNPYGLKYNELLAGALGVPTASHSRSSTADALSVELAEVIKLRQLKCLVIDELHDALLVGKNEQRRFLSLIKGLSNEPFGLSIVAFGINIASSALSSDQQMSRRFSKIHLDDWHETEAFRSFLAGWEQQLPLKKPSNLDGEELVTYLLANTLGRMDDVAKLLRAAACYAVTTGEERITVKLLAKAKDYLWGY